MSFKKGTEAWKQRKKVGTKTIAEIVEGAKERITQEALIELANKVVYKRLKEIDEGQHEITGTKEIALPITLKGIKEVKDLNVHFPKPIYGGKSKE